AVAPIGPGEARIGHGIGPGEWQAADLDSAWEARRRPSLVGARRWPQVARRPFGARDHCRYGRHDRLAAALLVVRRLLEDASLPRGAARGRFALRPRRGA